MPIVELTHIDKSFGMVKAVDNVSFSLEKGELFGLPGTNGAGRITGLCAGSGLFRALALLSGQGFKLRTYLRALGGRPA